MVLEAVSYGCGSQGVRRAQEGPECLGDTVLQGRVIGWALAIPI